MSQNAPQTQSLPQATSPFLRNAPGQVVIRNVNWAGMHALYMKEVRRFIKVHLQTIWAPALTTLLFLVIFTVAFGRGGLTVMGASFSDFIAPGLIMMGMTNNAYQNGSHALLAGKMQGTLVDFLMPPISPLELLLALVCASMTRAFAVGAAIWVAMLVWPGVNVMPSHLWAVIYFGFMGAAMLALIGVLTSIWAEKFDHAAAVGNFLVAPLSLLSGTFYSMENVAPLFRAISQFNPFFYAISGFRYGFLAAADAPVLIGVLVLLVLNSVMGLLCYLALKRGWKVKA